MMRRTGKWTIAGVLAVIATAGCGDIPLLPQWSADWYLPLASERVDQLFGPTTVSVPGGTTSPSVGFGPITQPLDEGVGSILESGIDSARVIMSLSKSLPLSTSLTLEVAGSIPDLGGPGAINFPINMSDTDTQVEDTLTLNAAQLNMISQADTFAIRVSGTVSNPVGAGNVTVNPTDGINVRLAIIATIPVSREGGN
jgi:hypothetical protein